MTPTQFNSEYEILSWLSRHENFAHGVAELRAASANGQLTGGRGLVEKWLSVYDDVTAGRVVTSGSSGDAAAAAPLPPPDVEASARASDEAAAQAGRRMDAHAARSIVQESQLWAEASREAAGRADLAAGRLQEPLQRARRWGKFGFAFGLLALLLVLAQLWLLWPQIEPQLLGLQRSAAR